MKIKSSTYLVLFCVLLAVGLVLTFFLLRPVSPKAAADRITHNLQELIVEVNEKANGFQTGTLAARDAADRFYFFEYKNNQLSRWSTNVFVPPASAVTDSFSVRMLKTSSGYYLTKKWKKESGHFILAVIPLRHHYKIVNAYLSPEWNRDVFSQTNIVLLDAMSGSGARVYLDGHCVFRVSVLNGKTNEHSVMQWLAGISFVLSFATLVIFLFKVLPFSKGRAEIRFVFLVCLLLPARILSVKLSFLHNLIGSKLFNPIYFASSSYNASLGDLVLNELVVVCLCYYLFRHYHQFRLLHQVRRRKFARSVFSIIAMTIFFFSMLFPFVVIQTLHHNSSISLNIYQSLQFDTLRITAILAVLISWTATFFFAHVFLRAAIVKGSVWLTLLHFAAGALVFIVVNQYSGQQYLSSLATGCVYFLLVFFSGLYARISRLTYAAFTYLFIAVFCFSANSAFSIEFYNAEERAVTQFRFANNFLIDRDYFGEYLLHESAQKIGHDIFIQKRMSSPFLGKDPIKQKVRQLFLPGYFNKYDIEILLFNSSGNPIDSRTTTTFSELINLYDQDAFKTDYREVYFINSPSNEVTQRYLVIIPINRSKVVAGYVTIELSMKKVIPDNVYPELLVDNRFQQFYKTQDLSYAVFANNKIAFRSGEFNYEGILTRDWLGNPALYREGILNAGYFHIAQEDDFGKVAVVSSKVPSRSYELSTFSFLFVLGLFMILLFVLFQGSAGYLKGRQLFFAARIQLFLNLAFFIPLIVVSIVTLSLISRSSQEQLNAEYLNKSRIFGEQLVEDLDNYLKGVDENQPDFENTLTNLAQSAILDANVYNAQGKLMATSQPLIFENGLLSMYVNPAALLKIRQRENLFIEKEHVGTLEYYVSYAALKSPITGKLIGILGIPFFQSASSLANVQIVILTNILNIFAAIFILLLVLSYVVSKWLTFPLTFITNTLRKTSLTKTNQPLTWQTNDEIGLMVKEYNQMLFKLNESKVELEQIQRERAWREIAQQVAHEIKNPLTPMKLTLQQMERALQAGLTSQEKMERALLSLLEQVDTLNDIASSFSTFAKMPEPVIQRVALITLLRRITELHAEGGQVKFDPVIPELYVQGDEQLLGRTFSNIILNALQAAREEEPICVVVTLSEIQDAYVISFSDNGKGIDAANVDRVFVPHFSTKKSGSGLGLAIARQAIEHMGGKIWFETALRKGTTFYIELPRTVE